MKGYLKYFGGKLLVDLKTRGLSILFITHDLHYIVWQAALN